MKKIGSMILAFMLLIGILGTILYMLRVITVLIIGNGHRAHRDTQE